MNELLFPDSAKTSSASQWYVGHCDGGSRGNPGPSGFGAVVEDPQGKVVARLSEFLGIQTNNFAEYSGLLAVLKWANENGTKCLRVISDSELMVKQMQGKYAVKSPGLKPLYEEARRLSRQLTGFELRHTLRAGNKEADELANQAMDRGMGKSREQGAGIRDETGLRAPAARPYGRLEPTPHGTNRGTQVSLEAGKPPRQVLEGYVKGGVVHLLSGELPDGVFVKIVRE